ncbi:putative F-box/LRR-repeat protein 23 isoform X2 [Brassica napus]|uniref:putative F-box/LRR-repeat protein 23 isoform X2 n=1 Tax=Brassica napus TaxID=3708 RepID=UPI00207A6CB0|nr:putative F-box/LRR-repeat protein 23 isoform X2 [Brassica napus]
MASSSSSLIPVMKDRECRSWSELPYELTSSILRRLDYTDILVNAQRVCTSWRRVCKDPAMWRKIDMRDLGKFRYLVKTLCRLIYHRHILDLSQGGLVELDMWYIGSDSLLDYIADRSSNLRSLKLDLISMITTDGLTEALGKLPLLEELELSRYTLSGDSLRVVGQSCPKLKTLKLHSLKIRPPGYGYGYDDDALAISETLHGLRFLLLFGNCLTKVGLNAILDNCPDLEHLDLRLCFNFKLVGDLEKRCSERIKVLRRPFDSPECPYDEREIHADISDDEVPFVPDVNSYDIFESDSDYSDSD